MNQKNYSFLGTLFWYVSLGLHLSHLFTFTFCLRCILQFEQPWTFTLSSHAQVLAFELSMFSLIFFVHLVFVLKGVLVKQWRWGDLSVIIMSISSFVTFLESLTHELLMFCCMLPLILHCLLMFHHMSPFIEPSAFYLHRILWNMSLVNRNGTQDCNVKNCCL
jgi:hypothetical protein